MKKNTNMSTWSTANIISCIASAIAVATWLFVGVLCASEMIEYAKTTDIQTTIDYTIDTQTCQCLCH